MGASSAGTRLRLALVGLVLLLPMAAPAQSCSLCRDETAGSAPHARAALQKGIFILGIPAAAVFAVILVAARRFRGEP